MSNYKDLRYWLKDYVEENGKEYLMVYIKMVLFVPKEKLELSTGINLKVSKELKEKVIGALNLEDSLCALSKMVHLQS